MAVLALAGLAMVAGVGAAGAATPAGGAIRVFATVGDGINGKIVIAGAIGDYGKTFTMDKNGKGDSNGNFVKITLKKGTFVIDSTELNKKTNAARPSIISNTTCSFAFSGTGPVTLSQGTGAYAGISGTVSITLDFGGVGPVYKSGPKKGRCNMSNTAPLVAQSGYILGKGDVRFG
ncbi:MAG TPA: hypothetical protein VG265_00575 [Gaiellaceae bacterium]|nr:hypothetical protein [Gaiellaceae bacterium]